MVRICDSFVASQTSPAFDQVTAIIKTFERPESLKRLVKSIRRIAPGLSLIVADDSKRPIEICDAKVIRLPYDSGVSAGRRAALEQVETPLVMSLDDDFIFYSGTRIRRALCVLDSQPKIDLVGGVVVNMPHFGWQDCSDGALWSYAQPPILLPGMEIAGCRVQDKVPNFFVARTERLRQVNWDPVLKRIDHADFFTRARGKLVSVLCPVMRCLHAKTPFDAEYRERRLQLESDRRVLTSRYATSSEPNGGRHELMA